MAKTSKCYRETKSLMKSPFIFDILPNFIAALVWCEVEASMFCSIHLPLKSASLLYLVGACVGVIFQMPD